MTILRSENLKKSFSQRLVVKGVNLNVHSGEIISLLGRNGAGKTTTFHMMVGLLKPDSGSIYLDATDISRFTTSQRADSGITYLPQENSVFIKTSVENNLKLVIEFFEKNKKQVNKIAQDLLEELGLSALAKQSAHSLSGGERRRLEICRSLVLNPKFLLLDEPFTGIDPITIVELQKILLRLKETGIGVMLSDHNVRDALKVTDRAYVIEAGEILIEGSPHEVAANEKARTHFLGQEFRLGDEVESYSS